MLMDFPCTGSVFKNIARMIEYLRLGKNRELEVSSSQFLEL